MQTSQKLPDERGRFGQFGGRFVPETLMNAIEELEREYAKALVDEQFQGELRSLATHYVGRPTPLYHVVGRRPTTALLRFGSDQHNRPQPNIKKTTRPLRRRNHRRHRHSSRRPLRAPHSTALRRWT